MLRPDIKKTFRHLVSNWGFTPCQLHRVTSGRSHPISSQTISSGRYVCVCGVVSLNHIHNARLIFRSLSRLGLSPANQFDFNFAPVFHFRLGQQSNERRRKKEEKKEENKSCFQFSRLSIPQRFCFSKVGGNCSEKFC